MWKVFEAGNGKINNLEKCKTAQTHISIEQFDVRVLRELISQKAYKWAGIANARLPDKASRFFGNV